MDLARLLRPRSIAVIGGRPAERVLQECRKLGFQGAIWPVHPKRAEMAGERVVPRVQDLPAAPDAAFVAVNRYEAIRVVEELAALGAGGAVVYASGFAEIGQEGRLLQERLVQAAGTMPILGPNCYGFVNYLERAALWPDQHGGIPVASGVVCLLQSGNMALNLTMQRRALPLAAVVSVGNQAQIGFSALIRAFARDPRVTAIVLHLEGLDDAEGFAAAVMEARQRRVPIVALSGGLSGRGRDIALGHTASLASEELLTRTWLARLGIPLVEDLPSLIETAKLLHAQGPLTGRRVVSLSCSGGEAALVADLARHTRLAFRPFTEAERSRIAATLNGLVHITNPLDYHTFIWGDAARMRSTFAVVLSCGFDFAFLVLDFPRDDRCESSDWEVAAEAFAAASSATEVPAGIVATLPEGLPEARAMALAARGLIPLVGLREALTAIDAAASIGEVWRSAPPPPVALPPLRSGAIRVLDEDTARAWVAAAGVLLPEGATVSDLDQALALASRLGWPLVVKAVVPGLVHKTEAGALQLGIRTPAQLKEAVAALLPRGGRVRIERMIEGAVAELLLGFRRDPSLGGFLLLAAGGTRTELLSDRIAVPLPVTEALVRDGLAQLRVFRLLEGFRGQPPGDLEAVVKTVLCFAKLVEAKAARLVEAEINPLLVLPAGQGAVAVDVFMRVSEGEDNEP